MGAPGGGARVGTRCADVRAYRKQVEKQTPANVRTKRVHSCDCPRSCYLGKPIAPTAAAGNNIREPKSTTEQKECPAPVVLRL